MNGSQATDGVVEAALGKTLEKIEIPPRPAMLDKLAAEMQQDEPDFRRLANLILADVGLSASLIKTANSPAFGYRSKAATVRDALTMLGLINVLRTLSGLALRQAAPETPALKGFWETSSHMAHTSGWLVKQIGVQHGVRSEDAYTYALFHDCGIPVLLKALPGYEATYLRAIEDGGRPITAAETEAHSLNHALVGCAIAKTWYLPDLIVQSILNHHENISGQELTPACRRLIAVGQLSATLVAGATGRTDHEWARLAEDCLRTLEIGPAKVGELAAGVKQLLREIE
jgi:HD-like signal output (HDOD) protein